MKRVIGIVVLFLVICLIYEFGVLLFVKHYDYEYIFTKGKKEYNISEKYNYIDGKHIYDISIKDKNNNEYIYIINHNYHKEKEILEDLLVFNKDKATCIFPIFKDKITSNIVCNVDGNMKSYTALVNENNSFVYELQEKIIKKGYKVPAFTVKDSTKEKSNIVTKIKYYTDFIPNYNILVWGYKGVFSVNKNDVTVNDFLKSDIYDTKYLTVGKKNMYLIDSESGMQSFDKIYAMDLKNGKTSIVDVIEENISSNSYFNGVYDNTVYFTDCNGNHQYKFNEGSSTVEKIDSKGYLKYYNGRGIVNEAVDDIANSNVRFNKNIINDEITKIYNTADIKKSNNHYYFRTNDGKFYLALDNNYKKTVLLFSNPSMKEWIVVNDTIFGIIGNTLYVYNYDYGLKPLIIYDEFNYHTDNMFGVIEIGD